MRLVKELAPAQGVGFIVQDDSPAARAAGMHRLHRLPGAEVVGLHWGLARAEVVQVRGCVLAAWAGAFASCCWCWCCRRLRCCCCCCSARPSTPLLPCAQLAREAGHKVHAWTANTAAMMRQALDAGVHAVVTNHPLALAAAVDLRLHACRQRRQEREQQEERDRQQRQQQQSEQQAADRRDEL